MTGPDLELAVSGRVLRFPAIWFRGNCACPECVAPGTTQKLKDITDLPNGVAVTHTEHAGDSVTVTVTVTATSGPRTASGSGCPRTWTRRAAGSRG